MREDPRTDFDNEDSQNHMINRPHHRSIRPRNGGKRLQPEGQRINND